MLGVYLFSAFLIAFGILGLIGMIIKLKTEGAQETLDLMLKNGDISSDIYVKYKNL